MAGVKGRSGPQGEKPWRQALMLAVNRPDDGQPDRKLLAKIAEQVAIAAAGGDMQAAKEIGDRLDGKAPQAIVGDSDADPINVLTTIKRVIVGTGNPDGSGVPPAPGAGSV